MTVAALHKAPSEDKRWRIVDAAMRRQGFDSHALIESLHAVQQAFGFLDDTAMRYVAKCLRVPLSKVYGVATFYHYFTLKPQGKHVCVVCLGTACYIKGSGEILKDVSKKYRILDGQTTPDGELSLLSARCIGACGLAPATVIDGDVVGKASIEQVSNRLERTLQS
ncbi:MAG: bidirectional hydrogenase complex protein HoxE [Phycisphaerae bacterium]